MQLKPGTLLQGGKYRIIRALGHGGFGITYEAEQVLLRRKVAVKEFFMKDCCERDEATSRVTVGTGSQRALVEKFRVKFIREAQMIAGMDNPHIVRVLDVFEENETAYYVMDYLTGGSLADKVKKDGPLSEEKAEMYIRQVAEALAYIHSHNTVHLDVKPSNILLNAKGDVLLIDFGISKHYDDSGEQTSSTPVGISKGYAPLEQGRDGDVSQFKPSTDIYALGATLYYLVTGIVPPEASIVNEDGLTKPEGVSDKTWTAINGAMQPRRKDRLQDVNAFLALLDGQPSSGHLEDDEEKTVILAKEENRSPVRESSSVSNPSISKYSKNWLWALVGGVGIIVAIAFLLNRHSSPSQSPESFEEADSVSISVPVTPSSTNSTDNGAVSGTTSNSSTPKTEPSRPPKEEIATTDNRKDEKTTSVTKPKIKLEQNRYEFTAYAGYVFWMGYVADPGKTVYWTSSNPSILAVSSTGEITVRSSGTATITASVDGEEDSCVCIVHFKPQNEQSSSAATTSSNKTTTASSSSGSSSSASSSNMYLSQTSANLRRGETLQLKAYNYGKTLKWESSKPQIATVSSNGLVSAVSPGEVRIWATGDDNVSRLCTITVLHTTYKPPVSSNSATANDMALSINEITLRVGQTYQLKAYNYGKTLKWESLKPEVATVSSNGLVRAVSPGRTRIWVSGEGEAARTCSVTVQR